MEGEGVVHSPSMPGSLATAERGPSPSREFLELYRAHFPFVWRSLRRLGVAQPNLDDATQEVFLVVHRRLADFEGRSTLRTWIFGISLRVARDFRRRAARGAATTSAREATTMLPDQGPSPLEVAERHDQTRLLESALAALPEERRAILVLAELEGFTVPEIAEALAINLNTAYSRLRLARKAFSAAVAKEQAQRERSRR